MIADVISLRRARGARSSRLLAAVVAAVIAMAGALSGAVVAASGAHAEDILKRVTVKGSFADVRTDLQDAIINQGLKIDYNGKIGDMLKRTGSDVGSSKEIYDDAEYFTFCSSRLSRAMMEADPINVGMCPYMMFVFTRAGQPGEVTIGYRAAAMRGDDASQKALQEINTLLDTIMKDASK